MAAEEAGTKDKVSRLFEYFRSVWFGLYSPEQWSVYKDGQRTTPLQLIRLPLQLIPIRLALLTRQLFQFRPQLYLSLCASFVIITRSTQCAYRVVTHCAMSVRLTWIDGCKIQLIILKEESKIVFFVVNMLFKLC